MLVKELIDFIGTEYVQKLLRPYGYDEWSFKAQQEYNTYIVDKIAGYDLALLKQVCTEAMHTFDTMVDKDYYQLLTYSGLRTQSKYERAFIQAMAAANSPNKTFFTDISIRKNQYENNKYLIKITFYQGCVVYYEYLSNEDPFRKLTRVILCTIIFGAMVVDIFKLKNVECESLRDLLSIYNSTDVQHSKYVCNSCSVSNSTNVINSTRVVRSRLVHNSKGVKQCDTVINSDDVSDSQEIYNSKRVTISFDVKDSLDIHNSKYVRTSTTVRNSLDVIYGKDISDCINVSYSSELTHCENVHHINDGKSLKNKFYIFDI